MMFSTGKKLVFGCGVLLSLGFAAPVAAQGTVRKHLVYFRDKTGTPFTVGNPSAFLSARALARRTRQNIPIQSRDLPVNPAYVAQLRAVAGAPRVLYTSRWFNAAVVACDSTTLRRIQALPIIASALALTKGPGSVRPDKTWPVAAEPRARTSGSRSTYGIAFPQNQLIGAVAMHDAGYRGEGMQVAVFDAGFPNANQISVFQSLRSQNRILGTRNFVDGNRNAYTRNDHGTHCFSIVAGDQPGFFVGSAPKASYYLCITEDANSEHPVEEANWLAAAEYADSVGVDVISSSLGYTDFDAPSRSYTYADMNGRTAISSRAAAVAARVGMVVVVANGNEGASAWKYVSAPADADSIISVGAVDSLGRKAGFSSFGPSSDGRIKPTLSSQGVFSAIVLPSGAPSHGNGTSYACPNMAGLATGLWQAHPTLTAQQIIQVLRQSATQANNPDNSLGYGIPNFQTAHQLATAIDKREDVAHLELYPNPTDDGQLKLRLPKALQGAALEVRIIDAKGAVVRRLTLEASAVNADVALNAGYLAKGTYLCEVSANGNKEVVRFLQK